MSARGPPRRCTFSVTNSSTAAAKLVVTPTAVSDRPGPLGGRLSDRLILRITDADGTPRTSTVLSAAGVTPLPTVRARSSRTWLVTLDFPDGGTPASSTTGDNVFQGSDMSFRLDLTQVPR